MNQFEAMQTFVRVVEAGSISKAAEQMNKVKSAVSRRLNELESYLGVTLLTRTTRSLSLTDTGNNYYQECLRILGDLANIESQVRDENCSLTGRIKVAAPLSFGLLHLQPALSQFNQRHPDINFEIDLNDRQIDLIEEGFDIAIRITNLKDSSLIAKKLTQTRLILSASPEYLKKYGIPKKPQDLKNGYTLLRYRSVKESIRFKASSIDGKITQGKEYKIKIPSALISNNGDYLYQAALQGQGLILSPDFICHDAIKKGQLIPILEKYLYNYELDVYALYPFNRHLSLRTRKLIDFLSGYFGT